LTVNYYITKLLLSREGLVIPGLGSFTVQERSARIDADKNVIIPPSKQYFFNPKITEDSDEILTNTIANEENTSFIEAKRLVYAFTEKVTKEINSGEKYEIKNIGYFYKHQSGKINFSQFEKSDLTSGLKELETEPFELISQPGKTQPKAPERAPRAKVNKTTKAPKKKKTKKVLIALTSTLLILLLAFFVWYLDLYKMVFPEENKKKQVVAEQTTDQQTGQETKKDTSDAKLEKVINKMTDKKKALMYKPKEEKEVRDSNKYYIVAGSFKVRKNASKYMNQLTEKGFNPSILEKDNLFRITLKSFNNKEDALVALYQMRDTGKHKSIWLLTVPGKEQQEKTSH